MHDYNGDGKYDAHDDAIFHNVIMEDSNNAEGANPSGGSLDGGSGSSIVSTIVVLIIMEIFKPGRIFSGMFPTLVWLVCIVILFLKFGCWLEYMTR